MTQEILGLGIKGVGIVAVLIIAGILLIAFGSNPEAGNIAIWSGIVIGIIFGILGIVGNFDIPSKKTLNGLINSLEPTMLFGVLSGSPLPHQRKGDCGC